MLEKDIEKVLVAEVRKLGGRAYKWVSPGNGGVPDRIVVFPDRPPVFVELKAENGKLSVLQTAQLRRLQDMGQDVRVLRGIQEVEQFLEDGGYTFPVVMDVTGEVFYSYGISAFPTTFMIGADGNVFGYVPGALTGDMMESIVQQTIDGVEAGA